MTVTSSTSGSSHSKLMRPLSATERIDAVELDLIAPLKDTHPTNDQSTRYEKHGPCLSADLLSERNRRSRSEER